MNKSLTGICRQAIKDNTDGDRCQKLSLEILSTMGAYPVSRLRALIHQVCTDAFNAKILEMELVRQVYAILESEGA